MSTNNGKETERKSVADIIIDVFLKQVDEVGQMPWQQPYRMYCAFNWYTNTPYRGINKLLLPFGEYLTINQMIRYNKENGTNFRSVPETKWREVVFFKNEQRSCSKKDFDDVFEGEVDYKEFIEEKGYANRYGWTYAVMNGMVVKTRNILRYTRVADIHFFRDENGNCLSSKLETGEVQIISSKPQDIVNNYVNRVGVRVQTEDYTGVPCYVAPPIDCCYLNKHTVSEDEWWSTEFHELAHSSGIKKRLNREYFQKVKGITSKKEKSDLVAVEECIAEITASMLCAECDIHTFSTSESSSYSNNIAYVKGYKERIRDWGKSFIYIVSEAEKAFNYIIGQDSLKSEE